MIVIQLLLAAGFIVSVVAHVVSLTDVYQLPRFLATTLHFGSAAGIFASMYISKQTRQTVNVNDFKKIITAACPHWLLVTTGLLVMYAFAGLLYTVLNRYSGSAPTPESAPARYFTGHWPALYALAFMIVDSCRRYLNGVDNNAHRQ